MNMEKHLKFAFQFGLVMQLILVASFILSVLLVRTWFQTAFTPNEASLLFPVLMIFVGGPVLVIHFVWSIILLIASIRGPQQNRLAFQRKTLVLFSISLAADVILLVIFSGLIFLITR